MLVSTEIIDYYNIPADKITALKTVFVNQGLKTVTFRLNAFSEQNTGAVSPGLGKLRAFIAEFSGVGIECNVDFHTWNTSFPFESQNYIKYLKANITALEAEKVYSYHLFNEPPAKTATDAQNQYLLSLIDAARSVTSKPISGRFMGLYNCYTNHYSREIDQKLDYVCVNAPWVNGDYWNPLRGYASQEQTLKNIIAYAHNLKKDLWITEFGKQNSSIPATATQKESQRQAVAAFIGWGKINALDRAYCWTCQPDHAGTEHFNITDGKYGFYPAFYELKTDAPPEPPSQTETYGLESFVVGYQSKENCTSEKVTLDGIEAIAFKPSSTIPNSNITECNTGWLPKDRGLKVGDKVIFECWLKSDPANVNSNNGLMAAFDLYNGTTGRVRENSGSWFPWGLDWAYSKVTYLASDISNIQGFLAFVGANWRNQDPTPRPIPAAHYFYPRISVVPAGLPDPAPLPKPQATPNEWIITATTDPPTGEWKIKVTPIVTGYGWF